MNLSLEMTLICDVCELPHGRSDPHRMEAVLCGIANKYVICCCCKTVIEDHTDKEYRKRWRKYKKTGGVE